MDITKLLSENPGINLTVSASDLLKFGESIVNQTAKSILDNQDEKIYTREEVLQKFKISPVTLWRWDKLGVIKGKKIGNRRYYPESEIKRLIGQKGGWE